MSRCLSKRGAVWLPLLCLVLLAAACSPRPDQGLLQQRLNELAVRPGGAIEVMPALPEYETFTYGAASLRSPFERPQVAAGADGRAAAGSVQPDFNRTAEPLEDFDLDSLRMVGVLRSGQRVLALVRDGSGHVHRVAAGNYLGRNHGQVQSVSSDAIQLLEIVPSGDGAWVERPRVLSLTP